MLWHAATMTDLNNKHSHNFWDTHPTNRARTIMRLKWGKEYNAKHSMQMGKPYASNGKLNGKCPLPQCGKADGCGHMLGGCENPEIQSIIIKRHNEATQLLHKAVMASDIGGCYAIMDAGNKMRADLLVIKELMQREVNKWTEDKVIHDKTHGSHTQPLQHHA